MRVGNTIWTIAGVILLLGGIYAQSEGLKSAGMGMIVGALIGPLFRTIAAEEEKRR